MARLHFVDFTLRELPEGLSPIEIKKAHIEHGLELMTAMFRIIGQTSYEQAWLHREANQIAACTKIEELDCAFQLFGELGAGISNAVSGYTEELYELIPEKN